MPIELVTGLPGAGKTLLTIARYKAISEKEGRPIFQAGINELKLPWQAWEPEKWRDLPSGAIFIIDECQTFFPVRGRDRPAEWIEELAKHRHRGVDFVLITQNPMLLDSFVRRLCDRHWHIMRAFGTHGVVMHEFTTGVRDNVAQSRAGSIEHRMRYPREVFDLYKSAELHTVKRRIPARVLLLVATPFVLAIAVWIAVLRIKPDAIAERASGGQLAAPSGAPGQAGQGGQGQSGVQRMTRDEFLQVYAPRIAGLEYTAPVYDEVTKPVHAPFPAACVATAARCKCYSQQGTFLQVPEPMCRDFVRGGFFLAWDAGRGQLQPVERQPASMPPGEVRAGPLLASLGGGSRGTESLPVPADATAGGRAGGPAGVRR